MRPVSDRTEQLLRGTHRAELTPWNIHQHLVQEWPRSGAAWRTVRSCPGPAGRAMGASERCTPALAKCKLYAGVGSAAYTDDFFQSSMTLLCAAWLSARMMCIMSPVLLVGNVLEITLSDLSTRNSYRCPQYLILLYLQAQQPCNWFTQFPFPLWLQGNWGQTSGPLKYYPGTLKLPS